MAYTVNSSKRIVWVGSDPNNPYEIRRVIYCDNHGTPHDIWPCDAELDKVYLVRITKEAPFPYDIQSLQRDDETVEYHTDSNGEPTVTLLPYWEGYKNDRAKHNVYAIKGDVKIYETVNGQRTQNYETVSDCYFFSETRETKPGTGGLVPIIGEGTTKYGPRANSSFNGQEDPQWDQSSLHNYLTYTVSDAPGESQCFTPQCGYYDRNSGYIQLGYIFDPNYSTPMWIKRAPVYEALVLTQSLSNTASISSDETLHYGETLTVYPQIRRHAHAEGGWQHPDYERYILQTEDITVDYDSSKLSIVSNADGSYTISALQDGITDSDTVTFWYKESDESARMYSEVSITILPAHLHEVWHGNNYMGNKTIEQPINITIYEKEWNSETGEYSEKYVYNGYSRLESTNTTVVTCNNWTITPNMSHPGQSSTVSVYVGTSSSDAYCIGQYIITVKAVEQVYYHVSDDAQEDMSNLVYGQAHGPFLLGNNSSETINSYTVRTGQECSFGIKFGATQSMSSPISVYIPGNGEITDTTGNLDLTVMDGSSEVMINYTKEGSGSNYDFTVVLPIYSDSQLQNQLGTLTINVYQ